MISSNPRSTNRTLFKNSKTKKKNSSLHSTKAKYTDTHGLKQNTQTIRRNKKALQQELATHPMLPYGAIFWLSWVSHSLFFRSPYFSPPRTAIDRCVNNTQERDRDRVCV